jgi:hypothetical protein
MTLPSARLQTRRRIIVATILLAGLCCAILIYLNVPPDATSPLGDPEDSKQYLREVELYGGKTNVLVSEFRQWFGSLWHGRRLAFTVGWLTLLAALFFWIASTPLPPVLDSTPSNGQIPDGTRL